MNRSHAQGPLQSIRHWRRAFALIFVLIAAQPQAAAEADRAELAISAIKFGGSIGKLLWETADSTLTPTQADASRYTKLAYQVKEQIDLGRASSSLIKANFDLLGTTLAYAATVDPEPLSRAVASIGAWGAKKTGDALSNLVVEESQKQARTILAQGLKNSGLSPAELRQMTPDELRLKVADLKLGGQSLSEILKDNPQSLQVLQAHAVDIATDIGVEALALAQGTADDISQIKDDLAATQRNLEEYQDQVYRHLEKVETRVSSLESATQAANEKLDALQEQVRGNARAINTLTQVSYSGWTTSQKLQAVEGGLYPDLTASQKTALVESLKAEQTRERLVTDVQSAAQDFGDLAAIAGNLGLPGDLVKGLQGAQAAAIGIAQFASGNVLGGIASLTSLAGLGAPDAATERHAEMMKYLEQNFAAVNAKLDKVIELQIKTLEAVAALSTEQRLFRKEVLGQLDRIETTVLKSDLVLQAILLSEWTDCHALVNPLPLNGQFYIANRQDLAELVGDSSSRSYAAGCYKKMLGFLNAWVKSAQWSGQIIAALNFPNEEIAAEPELQRDWASFVAQRISEYTSARNFVLMALPEAASTPAPYLVRFAQPVVNTSYSTKLDSVLKTQDIQDRLRSFKCDQSDVLSAALKELLCFGLVDTSAAPKQKRWSDLLKAGLIGPHANKLIDTGITLSTIVDFSWRSSSGSLVFVNSKDVTNFHRDGASTALRAALAEQKGLDLLTRLRWLTESSVLQQSITYGDYTAKLIMDTLYDPITKSLNSDPKIMTPAKQLALHAMRTNPMLARNVVMIAMRRVVEDTLGGPEKARALRYRQTYYHLALRDFLGPQACSGAIDARHKLGELFEGWEFGNWVTSEQKQTDPALKDCPTEPVPDPNNPTLQYAAPGTGVGVSIADFYVLVPSPMILSTGAFDQPASLKDALFNRDRLNQAIVDRTIGATVKQISADQHDAEAVAASMSLELLEEGWGWQRRRSSH